MKQIAALVFLASMALACNNDLDLNADYQDIGLVYGLLNPKEDTQWVRIHRTYLGEGDPLNSVGNPDSIYYDSLVVRMEEYVNGNLTKTIPLAVDFTSKTLDSGLFTTQDYRLYRTTEALNGNATYKLVIEKPEGGPSISGETPVTATFPVERPFNTVSWGVDNQFSAEFQYAPNANTYAYQPYLRMYYTEQNRNNKADTVLKYVDYRFPQSIPSPGTLNVKEFLSHSSFLNFVKAAVPVDPNVDRFFRRFEVYVWGAAEDLYTYARINAPSNGIVTERPEYTNLTNAYGIFSSRVRASTTDRTETGTLKRFLAISADGLESLELSDVTCNLRFARIRNLGPVPDTCFCGGNGIEVCN